MISNKVCALAFACLVLGCGDKQPEGGGETPPGTTAEKSPPKADKAPTKKGEPMTVNWADYKFTIDGKPKLKGNALIINGEYTLTLQGFPKGTKWSVDDKKGATDSPYASVKVADMRPKFGDIPVADLRSYKLPVDKTVSVVLPNGSHADFVLPPARVGGMDQVFKGIENGPVTFAGESQEDPKPGTSIILAQSVSSKVFGQASKLSEVDAVAMVRKLDEVKGEKKCTGYKDNNKKPMPPVTLKLIEHEVTIYDRRKGGEIDKKVFAPDTECPMFTFTRGDNSTTSNQPTKKIENWLRSKAK